MKVAVTADVHLISKNKTPNRWQSLVNILNQLNKQNIQDLVIAGDLFNIQTHNYSDFDNLCQEYRNINFHLIPGNHDPDLKQKDFVAENIKVYQEPKIIPCSETRTFFVPYYDDKSMADVLHNYKDELTKPWVLISHADWAETIREVNPVEPGVYMPLTRDVLNKYQPSLTVLGHIHKQLCDQNLNVYYPGSPCGLDITETGPRSYLIIDFDDLTVTRKKIETNLLYFDETVFVYPAEDEEEHWRKAVGKIKNKWDLASVDQKKAVIRITVNGFTTNKKKLKKFFERKFKEYPGWKDKKINVDQLGSSTKNYELVKISNQVINQIKEFNLEPKEDEPSEEEIIYQAAKTIYLK